MCTKNNGCVAAALAAGLTAETLNSSVEIIAEGKLLGLMEGENGKDKKFWMGGRLTEKFEENTKMG